MQKLDIDRQDWTRLSHLLDQALDLPAAERSRWVNSLGKEHESLQPRLRELLERAALVETGEFLNAVPRFDADVDRPGTASVGDAGDIVGPYRLVRALGSGGMGSVWLAERTDGLITRPVALKLPHVLGAQRAGLVERMAREREILATLDHRNIARLLDAGVADSGQPFLALEYVEGIPIDRYCATGGGKPLGLSARLRLFRQVAEAVAYAHGKLVLHRDLKPANILVNAGGGVKLLDFGIAKLLDQGRATETRLTEIGGRALTLDYASPEQILGDPLTVASDVYSLGVILHELLTGARPYHLVRDSRGALEDAILKAEPRRMSDVAPRAMAKALRGDLETVAAKALKKNPRERYATVNEFGEDIARYLSDRPVVARPDSAWYRLRKFIARNKLGVAAGAGIFMAIVAGGAVAVWQMVEANAQRDASLLHQRRAEAFSQFMGVLLHDAGDGTQRLTQTELLDRGVNMLEKQRGMDEHVSSFMWYEISRSYRIFGQPDRERRLLERGAAGARRIGDANLLAASECALVWSQIERDRASAERRLAQAQATLATVRVPAEYARTECLRAEARMMHVRGDIPGAIALIERARPGLESMRERQGWHYALLLDQLAGLYRAAGRNRDSLAISEQMLATLRDTGRADSLAEMMLMSSYARDLCRVGEVTRCAAIHDEVMRRVERADLTRLPPVGVRFRAGVAAWQLGQSARAFELTEAELPVAQGSGNRVAIANARLLEAAALLSLQRVDEAATRLAALETLLRANPEVFAAHLAELDALRLEVRAARGDSAGAWVEAQRLLARKPRSDRLARIAAALALREGDAKRAEELATEALEAAQQNAREAFSSADVGLAALLRAEVRRSQGRLQDARADAGLARACLGNGLGESHPSTLEAARLLASLTN